MRQPAWFNQVSNFKEATEAAVSAKRDVIKMLRYDKTWDDDDCAGTRPEACRARFDLGSGADYDADALLFSVPLGRGARRGRCARDQRQRGLGLTACAVDDQRDLGARARRQLDLPPLAHRTQLLRCAAVDLDLEHEVAFLQAGRGGGGVLDDPVDDHSLGFVELVLERLAGVAKVEAGERAGGQPRARGLVVGLGAQVQRLLHVGERYGLLRELGEQRAGRRHGAAERGEQVEAELHGHAIRMRWKVVASGAPAAAIHASGAHEARSACSQRASAAPRAVALR